HERLADDPTGPALRVGDLLLVPARDLILLGANLDLLPHFDDRTVPLIYIYPPFNPRSTQTRRTLRTVADEGGDRTGFQGRRYRTEHVASRSYTDRFDDYVGFLRPRLEHARRLLTESGTLYLHLDYREAHYCKILLDEIFGREAFL